MRKAYRKTKKAVKLIRRLFAILPVLAAIFGVFYIKDNIFSKQSVQPPVNPFKDVDVTGNEPVLPDKPQQIINVSKEGMDLTISYIDVGQGDSVLIQLDGKNLLIDGGNRDKGTLVQKYLLDRGVDKLDVVISTHGDADHCSGLRVICQKFDVSQVYMSYLDHDTKTYQELKRIIADRMIPVTMPLAGDSVSFGPANILFVSPDEGETESNAASLAMLFQYQNTSFLFCGDAEHIALPEGMKVDVLMLPHHGSYSGNEIEKSLTYDYAVVSASGVDYGHPHGSTMKILKDRQIKLYRTDKQGTIVCMSDGRSIAFDKEPCDDYSEGTGDEEEQ